MLSIARAGARLTAMVCLAFSLGARADAYSVLSHEAVVDALWDVKLKPVLLARFPNSTPDELREAHAFAYGGAIIQDLGYYPHGSMEFSDLTHYVRTGDFILALIRESQNLDELAFALGALSHYVSDLDGHRFATNVAEAILYPELRRKYGDVITYEENPAGHLKTEFGFDVLEVARGNFAPQAYHDFIGFNVSETVLRRAVRDTYGLDLEDLFRDFHRAMESYRHAVSQTIPKATRVAWAQREDQIQKSEPGMTREKFVYVMKRSSYERNWGKQYDRPSAGERILAVLLKLVPPIGPLKALKFKMPTLEVEKLFMESFNRASAQYYGTLEDASGRRLELPNKNYDVGVVTAPGSYRLEDDAQAVWLDLLAKKNFCSVTPAIAAELLAYYGNPGAPLHTKRNAEKWKKLEAELLVLKAAHRNTMVSGEP